MRSGASFTLSRCRLRSDITHLARTVRSRPRRTVAPHRAKKIFHFASSQLPPLSHLQAPQPERTDRDARQLVDGMADSLAHPPDLAMTTLVKREDKPRLALQLRLDTHTRRTRQAIVEAHPARQPLESRALGSPSNLHAIDLGNTETRMREALRYVTVVGEQDKTAGFVVEAPYRKEVVAIGANHVTDRTPSLRIGHRGNHAYRLVVGDISQASCDGGTSVHHHLVFVRIGPGAEVLDHSPVQADAALTNQVLRRPPRRDPRAAQNLLDPFLLLHLPAHAPRCRPSRSHRSCRRPRPRQ